MRHLVLAVALAVLASGCGVRCTRTVRWLSNTDGTKSVITEYEEVYPPGWPGGWDAEGAYEYAAPRERDEMFGLPGSRVWEAR